jgi:uncharacterized protein YdeI (YjbR/CyaY-like superfamily)
MATDPRIDSYIEKAAPFAQPILRHLRELVHAAIPDLGETLKWGMPHFTHKGKNLGGFGAFKAHVAFMIHGQGRQGEEEGMGQFGKIATLSDLPPDDNLRARLIAGRDEIESGKKKAAPKRKPIQEIAIPDDLAAALSPAGRKFLDELAPSYRKEYLEWIAGAKRAETRAKRVAQAAQLLAEGKKMGWKYEGC